MLRLETVSKRFEDTLAVDRLSLEVGRGEFLSLLGPSGCGKTTTLRMIAGFETPSSGRIQIEGRDVTSLPPQHRATGMVFQSYALFPHLDVFENVAFGLKARGAPAADIPERVRKALARVDLAGYERRSVQALSGGQQQRVALARALAPEPPVLLLDEPLSNLDAALRERTRGELRVLLKEVGITAVFVTHDQEEAFHLSDRIAVLDRGRLQQVGSAESLYHEPVNPFVAAFVGQANFLDASVLGEGDGCVQVEIAGGARWCVAGSDLARGSTARVMTRPESLEVLPAARAQADSLRGRVLDRRFAGGATYYRVDVGSGREVVAAVIGRSDEDLSGEVAIALREGGTARAYPAAIP